MAAPDPPTSLTGTEPSVGAAPRTEWSALEVALLEDNDLDAEYVSRQLAKAWPAGVEVKRFGRLAELEAGLADEQPDVIFCDLSVPDGYGIELLQQAVALAGLAPVVVLTSADDPSFPVKALEMGAQDYLSKHDLDIELLARTLRYSLARSRADDALRQAAVELKTINTELEEYLGIMAHDLRAPLRTGRLFAERLIAAHRSGGDGEAVATALDTSLGRMEAMIERLLLLATLREGRPQPTLGLLSAVVDQVAVDLQAQIDAVGARFSVELDGSVLIDRSLFGDLLRHLAENSIKYRSPDRPLHVRFRAETIGPATQVTVRDNGIGIASEYHDRVFRLFERLDVAALAPVGGPDQADPVADGLGFGLACCRRIVELHRGTITITSPPDGTGIEARILLPASPGASWPELRRSSDPADS